MSRGLWLILILCPPLVAQTDSIRLESDLIRRLIADSSQNLFVREIVTPAKPVIDLPDSLIVENSLQVYWRSIQLPTVDYRLDVVARKVHLLMEIDPLDSIRIRYLCLPFGVSTSLQKYRIREIQTIGGDTVRRMEPIGTYKENSGDLRATGSISRGFSVGSNQDLSITSGLNVQIQGNLSEDVTVEATLTDQNIPIQPEGNTENIQKIDQVYVHVKKGNAYSATLGDIRSNFSLSPFVKYSRELQGLRLDIRRPDVQSSVSLGTTRGRFQTNRIAVSEGIQGPYELSGDNGVRNILVIAGSERVWLDGRLLRRGDANDYIMDYASGQIQFTERIVITAASRVVVDFEYAAELFPNNSLGAELAYEFAGRKARVRSAYIRESDDKSNPINLSLSREQVDSLAGLNDDLLPRRGSTITVDGAVRTDIGRGRYVKSYHIADAESIFVYVGDDSTGDHNVRFTEVGSGNGSYNRGNIVGEFVYVGPGNGGFLPIVPLSLPVIREMTALGIDLQPTRNLVIRNDIALSRFDRNSFSSSTLTGKAFDGRIQLTSQKIRRLGELDFDFQYRFLDSNFEAMDRLNDAEFDRSWNVSAGRLGRESLLDGQMRYRPWTWIQIAPRKGRYLSGSSQSDRDGLNLRLASDSSSEMNYDIYRVQSRDSTYRRVLRNRFHGQHSLSLFRPGFDFESEESRMETDSGRTGSAYYIARPHLLIMPSRTSSFMVLYEQREDFSVNSRLDSLDGKTATARMIGIESEMNGASWRNRLFLSRRVTRYASSSSSDQKSLIIRNSTDASLWDRFITLSLSYQLSDQRVQERKIVFVEVSPNTGDYVRVGPDSFRQVPRGLGDYVQGSIRSQIFLPVVSLQSSVRIRLDFARIYNDSSASIFERIASRSQTETIVRLEDDQQSPSRSFYFLNPQAFLVGDRSFRGQVYFRNDIFTSNSDRTFLLNLRAEIQKQATRLFTNAQDRQRKDVYTSITRWIWAENRSFETVLNWMSHNRANTISTPGIGGNFDIQQLSGTASIGIDWWHGVSFTPGITSSVARERINDLRYGAIGPIQKIRITKESRYQAILEMSLVRAYFAGNRPVPFELTQGQKRGWNFNLISSGEYRFREHISLNFSFSVRQERDRLIQIGSAEFRAYF